MARAVPRRTRSARARGPSRLSVPDRLVPLLKTAVAAEVLSSVRHDLVNHLSALANACFLIEKATAGQSEVDRPVQMLRTRVGAAVELLGREIAPPKADPEPVDPRARAARLVEEIAVPSGVELFGPGMASTAHVRIVPDELDLALLCLLENAVDAAATNGGAVRVRCAVRGGDMVALEIDDDGPGITPDALDHGFDAFFTTKPGHLGLGLPISRRIAYRWAGRVEVGPGSSGGTHATLLFPMERA